MKVVLITGAASGIGASAARRIAAPGVSLLLHTRRNRESLERVAEEAAAAGAAVELAYGDLGETGIAAALVSHAVDVFGTVDQIVANAGFARRGGAEDTTPEDVIAAAQAMPAALLSLARTAAPHLRKSKCGRIVAVSSFVAHVFAADALFAATAAAKAGLEAIAQTLAAEFAANRVTVNCIAPGYTRKDATGHSALGEDAWRDAAARIPMGRIGEPDDAAAVIAFLLSDDARFVTGQTIHVDGGLGLA